MSTVIQALFETVRTLSLAGEYLPEDRLSSIVDLMAKTYVEELPITDKDKTSFLESFELVKSAILAKPPTDEDEDVVRLAAYNLRQMEEKLGLNQDKLRDIFLRRIEEDLGENLANLVILFERSIRALG
ncbi:MAG: hypothetical protein QI199_08260 [Candidatus Korarchaeota archaeon]|nr:hypothetical protein [Candidatus Korarchaeota archaeon]